MSAGENQGGAGKCSLECTCDNCKIYCQNYFFFISFRGGE